MNIKTLLLLLFGLISLNGFSQNAEVKFHHYTKQQGLSSGRILCLAQDRQGFIWIGKEDGLYRFDGANFITYQHNLKDSASLSNNIVRCIYKDKYDDLYIGTDGGGLNLYNYEHDNFTSYQPRPQDKSSLGSKRVNALFEDRQGILWVSTGGGLDRFDRKTKKFSHYVHDPANPKSISSNAVMHIAEDKKGLLWIATEGGGVNTFDKRTQTFTTYRAKRTTQSVTSDFANQIHVDKQGKVWIGHYWGGLDEYEQKTKTFINHPFPENTINDILEDKEGNLWLAQPAGLRIMNKKTGKSFNLTSDPNNLQSLQNNNVRCLLKDQTGNIWVGSETGLDLTYGLHNSFLYFKHDPTDPLSLGMNAWISNFHQDAKNRLWVLHSQGFDCFDPHTKTFTHWKNNKPGLDNNITEIVEDKNQLFWITTGSGMYVFDPQKNTYDALRPNPKDSLSCPYDTWHIQKDLKGRLWVMSNSKGIFQVNQENKKFHPLTWKGKELPTQQLWSFFIDSEGTLWIGTGGAGLYQVNQDKGLYAHFSHRPDDTTSISSNLVAGIFEDKKGNMWIGTKAGLNHYNRKTHAFTAYTTKDGLPHNHVHSIQEDERGNLWLGTNDGLSRFNPQTKVIKNFIFDDGIEDASFRTGAMTTSTGEFLLAASNGFYYFHPDSFRENKFIPPVYLTDFRIFNKSVSLTDKDSPLKQNLTLTKEITLTYKQSVFSFEFAALNYKISHKNQYAYKMEGFDKDWTFVGNKRTATYTNLDPGEYTFRVKASNNDGFWNEHGTSIKIIITPPYWQTWWFRTLAIFAIVGSAIAFYLIRINAVKAQKVELEHQVWERTAEVVIQKEELQAQAEFLQVINEELKEQREDAENAQREAEKARQEAEEANRAKSTFLATMSHEIRTPMNGVIGMASLLAETNQTHEQREYTDSIRSCGDNLLAVINDILDFSKIESGKMELEQHDFDLRTCIEDVLDVFATKASQLGLDLVYQIDYNVPTQVVGDGLRLRQVLLNLVSNAMKFTQKGEIFVGVHLRKTAATQDLELGFEVRDTGIGIPADKLDRLFKAFSQVDSSTTRKYGGTGLGLVICEKLIGLMDGRIEVSSQPGEGTTFSFNIHIHPSTESVRTYINFNTAGLEGKRVLAVDDNATNRRILQSQLEQWQLVPVMAESGSQALVLLAKSDAFDLVITDMQMPGMDGIQLAQRIRKIHPTLPIMLLSSIGQERRENNPNLFCSVMTKPVKQHVLCNHILNELRQQGKAMIETPVGNRKLSEDFAQQFPLRILVAEDNLVNQKLAERILNKLGYQPVIANNGKLAVEALEQQEYDLVLMDIQMPEMDGLEATQVIRRQLTVQPIIIAMTANAMQGDREECLKAGMDDYISKPIKLEELVKVLEKWALQVQNKLNIP
ncbi:MAG: two-component regulator propeller domain-containing protein [Bacteroidota bacterium]